MLFSKKELMKYLKEMVGSFCTVYMLLTLGMTLPVFLCIMLALVIIDLKFNMYLNPAVVYAFIAMGKVELGEASLLILSQNLGGYLAGYMLKG